MAFVELLDGLPMEYEEAGEGKKVLLLVHGNFASARWWRPLLTRLPKGYRALAPSLRGFGNTPAAGEESLRQLAKDLEAFAVAKGLGRVHLVGHSLGAAVALQHAVDFPKRDRSLALLAPAPTAGFARMRQGQSRLARMLRAFDTDSPTAVLQLHAALAMGRAFGTNRSVLSSSLREMLGEATLEPGEFDALVDDAVRVRTDTTVAFLRELQHWDVRRELGRLKTPVLLVWGEKDPIVPREAVEDSVRDFRRARLEVWPDAGHSPQFEHPERTMATLTGFAEHATLLGRIRRALRMRRKAQAAAALVVTRP
ncbi:MAG TPA: alpha/beta hydrolase [Myxococcales bacterium]|jgi:branched-chain amino acid transport system permease protein